MTSYKKKYQWLLFVIYAGIFTRSIIFRILNTLIHPSMFLSSGGINTPDTRFFWLQISDTIFSVCSSVFFIGCVFILYFFTMVLPMSKSVVATVSVFTFLNVWNDYLWPSLVFTSSDLLTAQIGLNAITSNDNTTMGQTLAVITMITIPVIIIYSLFSKQIVEGVVSTGSKEG